MNIAVVCVSLNKKSYICNRNRLLTPIDKKNMNPDNILYKVYDLYADGFCNMTIGRTLWAVILIKLFVVFVVLKLLFFPDFLSQNAKEGEEDEYVAKELVEVKN